MRRLMLMIISVLSVIGCNAQFKFNPDSLLMQLKDFCTIEHSRSNYKHGEVSESYFFHIPFYESCIEGECAEGEIENNPKDIARQINDATRTKYQRFSETVGNVLYELMGVAEESYHHESHTLQGDTTKYTIYMNKSSEKHGDTIYYATNEFVDYMLWRVPLKTCSKHREGLGSFYYTRYEHLPKGETIPFNWERYHNIILPLLKQKGVKSKAYERLNEKSGTTTKGIIYTIPCSKQELAIALLQKLTNLTEQYITDHLEEMYSYSYGRKFRPCGEHGFPKDLNYTFNILKAWPNKDSKVTYNIECSMNAEGYHILIFNTK